MLATGVSLITPLGRTVGQNWEAVIAGASSMQLLPDMHGKCRIGGRLPDYDLPETSFKTKIHSLAAGLAEDCVADAGIEFGRLSRQDRWRTGCILANQYGCQEIRHETAGKLRLIKQMPHVVASSIAEKYGLMGHVAAPGGASVGSMMAVGEAFRLIRDGYMDRVLVGGLDFNCNQNVLPGMDAFGALCTTFNHDPQAACMPFDKKRAGTCLGDGGAMILLESEQHAEQRSARVYAEVAGYGQTNDASNVLRPLEDGVGIVRAIKDALTLAGLHPRDISAFNCHARATLVGDAAEVAAIRALIAAGEKCSSFEEFAQMSAEEIVECVHGPLPATQPILSGQKGNLGHSVAAAGAIESVFTLKCIHH